MRQVVQKLSVRSLFESSKPATCLGLLPVVAQFTPLRGHFADALVRVLFFFFNASSFSGCCSVAGCRSCQSTGEFEVWVDIALPALQKCQPLAGARCQPKMPDSQNNPAQKLDRSLPHFPEPGRTLQAGARFMFPDQPKGSVKCRDHVLPWPSGSCRTESSNHASKAILDRLEDSASPILS